MTRNGKHYDVVVIPGDGIGPELTEAATGVLRAAAVRGGFALALTPHEAGAALYKKAGRVMSDETLEACRRAHGVLKGPVGDPAVRAPDGTEAGVLGGVLRPGLDAYANIRPIRLYPGWPRCSRGARRARSTTWSCARTPRASTPREAAAS